MSNNIVSTLALCKKASFIIMGFDTVKESMESKKARLVMLASDLSPKTQKEAIFFATKFHCPIIKIEPTIEDLWGALSKKVGIVAITDKGFANKFINLYEDLRVTEQ